MPGRKVAIAIAGLVFAGLSLLIAGALWNASRALKDAESRVASAGIVEFRSISLDRLAPAFFESIGAPSRLRDATFFDGSFYACGPSGLLMFDAAGAPQRKFRPGFELPPAPLVAMAKGAGGSSSRPQLWIATAGAGLLIYDGRRFEQIRPNEEPMRNLTAVLPLSSGRILLGTAKNGVLVWDGRTLTEYRISLAGLQVTALAGSESDLWIGTMDRGVFRWHAGELDHFSEQQGLPDPRVLSIAVQGNATYIGTALGVAEFHAGVFVRVIAEGFFARSLLAEDRSLMVGTLEEGIVFVPLTGSAPRPRNMTGASGISDVERLMDIDGRIYVVASGGVYQQSKGRASFERVITPGREVLADGNITALDIDRAGRLWTGYFDRGLDIIEPNFEHATHVEDDHVYCVNRIVHSADGGMSAVATANGLALFDAAGNRKQVLTKRDGLIANQVADVIIRGDSRAPAIIAATSAGLTTIDASGTSSLYAFQGLVNNHVYALAISGQRWLAGTLGGLSILDSGIVNASYTTANSGLKHNWITAIVPVDNGWYVGTYGAGVLKFDSGARWSSFADWKSPAIINPNAMLVTDRAVFAGTLGKGLAIYHRDSGRWTFEATRLPSLNVTALTAGGGYLYVGTDNGLVRVIEKDLVAR